MNTHLQPYFFTMAVANAATYHELIFSWHFLVSDTKITPGQSN